MRKRILSLMSLVVLMTVLCSCGGENVITVKEKTIRMKKDESYTIKVKQTKEEKLSWSSEDESVAVVSPEGTVSAVGNGITVVTVRGEKAYVHVGVIVGGNEDYTDKDGNVVRVYDTPSDITEILVGVRNGGKSDITAKVGETHQLVAYTTPSNSKDPIDWTSADKKVARVDEKGVLQVVGKGTTTISAIAPNGIKGELIVRCK